MGEFQHNVLNYKEITKLNSITEVKHLKKEKLLSGLNSTWKCYGGKRTIQLE